MIAALALVVLLFVLLLARQNLLVLLGVAVGYSYLVWGDGRLGNIVVDAWDAANREILLSIPLFILAGNLMAEGAMARRLIRLMRGVTAPVPAGLAIAAVMSCALFAAVSGSGTVTLLAVGAVMYPALLEAGYSRRFAVGALCAAGTLGIIVPPSIPLILYGVMTRTSVAELFVAGIGPAALLTVLMSSYALATGRHTGRGKWDPGELLDALKDGIWALFMPVLIVGGIYSGLFTATESAAVAAVYAIVIELFVYREMDFRKFYAVVGQTTRLLGSLFPVLMMALSLNVLLAYEQVPERLVAAFSQQFSGPLAVLIGVNVFLLLLGCVMDIGSAIMILAPILQPVMAGQGVDPVHFGIIMVVNLEIGYLTPPLGLNLIVAMTVFREGFWFICRAVLPFMLLMLAGLVVISLWPGLSLFLPG